MPKYVKNPGGGVHSVPDDFEAPVEWGAEDERWSFVTEEEAREAAPTLFGADDPAVQQARLTDVRAADPADHGVPGPEADEDPETDGSEDDDTEGGDDE